MTPRFGLAIDSNYNGGKGIFIAVPRGLFDGRSDAAIRFAAFVSLFAPGYCTRTMTTMRARNSAHDGNYHTSHVSNYVYMPDGWKEIMFILPREASQMQGSVVTDQATTATIAFFQPRSGGVASGGGGARPAIAANINLEFSIQTITTFYDMANFQYTWAQQLATWNGWKDFCADLAAVYPMDAADWRLVTNMCADLSYVSGVNVRSTVGDNGNNAHMDPDDAWTNDEWTPTHIKRWAHPCNNATPCPVTHIVPRLNIEALNKVTLMIATPPVKGKFNPWLEDVSLMANNIIWSILYTSVAIDLTYDAAYIKYSMGAQFMNAANLNGGLITKDSALNVEANMWPATVASNWASSSNTDFLTGFAAYVFGDFFAGDGGMTPTLFESVVYQWIEAITTNRGGRKTYNGANDAVLTYMLSEPRILFQLATDRCPRTLIASFPTSVTSRIKPVGNDVAISLVGNYFTPGLKPGYADLSLKPTTTLPETDDDITWICQAVHATGSSHWRFGSINNTNQNEISLAEQLIHPNGRINALAGAVTPIYNYSNTLISSPVIPYTNFDPTDPTSARHVPWADSTNANAQTATMFFNGFSLNINQWYLPSVSCLPGYTGYSMTSLNQQTVTRSTVRSFGKPSLPIDTLATPTQSSPPVEEGSPATGPVGPTVTS